MITKEISLFEIADLQKPENAELKALCIEKNMDINVDYGWWTYTYDYFKEICSRIGIDVEEIYFSGFWSQGDGACFVGSYRYKKGSVKLLKEYCNDEELFNIAQKLQALQKSCFYRYSANITQSGRYCHEYTMETNGEILDYIGRYIDGWFYWKGFEDLDKGFLGCFRYLAKWLYKTLENEYDYLTSDNVVFETLECNGYTFNEFGEIEH